MPKVPKWVADAMESVFSGKSRKVSIVEVTYLNPHLKKITFKGDLKGVKFKIGQAIVIRVDDMNFSRPKLSFSETELAETAHLIQQQLKIITEE